MEIIHKICETCVNSIDDLEKVSEMLKNTEYLVSEVWCDNGKFKFEVFEKDQIDGADKQMLQVKKLQKLHRL